MSDAAPSTPGRGGITTCISPCESVCVIFGGSACNVILNEVVVIAKLPFVIAADATCKSTP
jgi:hypothetical protein